MIRFLFPRLTREPSRGGALFATAVAEARRPHWYVEGQVPDSLEGRFAVLATVVAMISVRLERGSDPAGHLSVALTERFIDAMDAEHREMGISDPGLGKTVRKLVGSLARRVELWRAAIDEEDWSSAVRESVYRGGALSAPALLHSERALRALWARIAAASDAELAEGRIG